MKLRSILEKSDSLPESTEAEEPLSDAISGAVRAWRFVVEINSVGRDIKLRSMVPVAYLTLVPRLGVGCSWLRLFRLVKARASDMVVEAIEGVQ
jgi:hypothetical protein